MKNKFKNSVLTCLLLLVFGSFNNKTANTEWNLEKSKNGILVYSSIPEGHHIKQIKVKATAKTTLSATIAVLKEIENYPLWIYNCKSSYKVSQQSKEEMIYYMQSSTPWPLQNRDLVVLNVVKQDKLTKKVHSTSTPLLSKIPKKEGLVRITDFYGEWIFTPLNENEITIEYYLKIDPAGDIPIWILNMIIDIGPYQTIEKFKQLIEQEKYKNATIDFIEN